MASLKILSKFQSLFRRLFGKRIEQAGGLEEFKRLIDKMATIPGLNGKNDRNWSADFDFIMQETSFLKLLEGAYDSWGVRPASSEPMSNQQF